MHFLYKPVLNDVYVLPHNLCKLALFGTEIVGAPRKAPHAFDREDFEDPNMSKTILKSRPIFGKPTHRKSLFL